MTYFNIKHFTDAKRKSNAGFLLFPGLFQLSMGSLFKDRSDPTRPIDIAVGATSALVSIARLIYPARVKAPETALLLPYVLPGPGGTCSGFCFQYRF